MLMEMLIDKPEEGIQLVKLIGRLDVKGTNEVSDAFGFQVGTEKASTIIDLSEVDFLASIGMRMLISTARAKANRKYQLVLLNPNPLVKEALVTAGYEPLIPIFNSYGEALAALKTA